jgi:P4 family phage/plasmid primase-like protien
MDQFLRQHYSKNGNYNHVLLTSPFGKYLINDTEELDKLILECKKNKIDFGMCECHRDDLPEMFYLDIDLLLKEPVDINEEHIKKLINTCNKVFEKNLKDYNNACYVFKKQEIERDTTGYNYKNGIHIYFPHISLLGEEREYVYQQIIEDSTYLFNTYPLVETNIKLIIDYRVIKTNAILKVFCNKPGKKTYEFYKMYNCKEDKRPSDLKLLKLLSIYKDYKTEFTAQLPEITEEVEERQIFLDDITHDSIQELTGMLSKERCNNYSEWIRVGMCLHNIDPSLLGLWKSWSEQVPEKAKKTRFNTIWNKFKFRDNGLKYGSLVLWAKTDSPELYEKFHAKQVEKYIRRSLEFTIKNKPTPIDIAFILKEKFGDRFVCSDITHKRWYEFRDNIWVEVQQGYSLFNKITEYLIYEYRKELAKAHQELAVLNTNLNENNGNSDTGKINVLKENTLKLEKLILALKDTTFKEKIMKEAMHLFFDEKFEENLNEKKNILVFNNGVYDLDKGILRKGLPTDYMTYSTNNSYREYDENDPNVQKVYHLFSQIHPNEEIRNFFFSTLGVSLHGNKVEQKCNIWTGDGSNGKSFTGDLCSKALGDFFHSPSITLFTRKAGASGNASPEKIVLKGRRIIIMQEPENDDKLNTSIMKQITGNDIIEARALYHETIRFKPQTSVFISCNDLPKVSSTDGGTWRRIRVVPFKSKFVSRPTKPNEYKVDPSLADQFDVLSEAFMSILIHYYNSVKKNDFIINEPNEVKVFTDEYKNDNDIYQDFINQHLEQTDNSKDRVKIVELYDIFKEWVKSNNPTAGSISKKDFQKQISVKIGQPKTTQSWTGYKFKSEHDETSVIF